MFLALGVAFFLICVAMGAYALFAAFFDGVGK
jgi:hypothetical protein